MITRPMLAASANDREELERFFPTHAMASPKLDGIRCLLHPKLGPVSRTFKPIANDFIRHQLSYYHYLDGEILTFTDGRMDDFNTVQSKVMSRAGAPDFEFHVFDCFKDPDEPFMNRFKQAKMKIDNYMEDYIRLVENRLVNSFDDFLTFCDHAIIEGYEGGMYRTPESPYKSGRSTLRQGWLVKWKDVNDAEGEITGFIEQLHNENEAKHDAFGNIERSSHKDRMKGKNTLGALLVNTQWGELRVGSGFDDITRKRIWQNQKEYLGRTITFKFQSAGQKNLPRFPIFKGFRND